MGGVDVLFFSIFGWGIERAALIKEWRTGKKLRWTFYTCYWGLRVVTGMQHMLSGLDSLTTC